MSAATCFRRVTLLVFSCNPPTWYRKDRGTFRPWTPCRVSDKGARPSINARSHAICTRGVPGFPATSVATAMMTRAAWSILAGWSCTADDMVAHADSTARRTPAWSTKAGVSYSGNAISTHPTSDPSTRIRPCVSSNRCTADGSYDAEMSDCRPPVLQSDNSRSTSMTWTVQGQHQQTKTSGSLSLPWACQPNATMENSAVVLCSSAYYASARTSSVVLSSICNIADMFTGYKHCTQRQHCTCLYGASPTPLRPAAAREGVVAQATKRMCLQRCPALWSAQLHRGAPVRSTSYTASLVDDCT